MKKVWAVLVLVVLIAACGGGTAASGADRNRTSVTTVTSTNSYGDYDYTEVIVNGHHCITMVYDWDNIPSISCDWSAK